MGCIIKGQGSTDADTKQEWAKQEQDFHNSGTAQAPKGVPFHMQINTNIKSVLLYGIEAWCTTKTTIKKVQTLINRGKINKDKAVKTLQNGIVKIHVLVLAMGFYREPVKFLERSYNMISSPFFPVMFCLSFSPPRTWDKFIMFAAITVFYTHPGSLMLCTKVVSGCRGSAIKTTLAPSG